MMQQDTTETQTQSDEPVGIVISRGWEPETTPRFSAYMYMWAPDQDDDTQLDAQAA
jgi:hypothetical protein